MVVAAGVSARGHGLFPEQPAALALFIFLYYIPDQPMPNKHSRSKGHPHLLSRFRKAKRLTDSQARANARVVPSS